MQESRGLYFVMLVIFFILTSLAVTGAITTMIILPLGIAMIVASIIGGIGLQIMFVTLRYKYDTIPQLYMKSTIAPFYMIYRIIVG